MKVTEYIGLKNFYHVVEYGKNTKLGPPHPCLCLWNPLIVQKFGPILLFCTNKTLIDHWVLKCVFSLADPGQKLILESATQQKKGLWTTSKFLTRARQDNHQWKSPVIAQFLMYSTR